MLRVIKSFPAIINRKIRTDRYVQGKKQIYRDERTGDPEQNAENCPGSGNEYVPESPKKDTQDLPCTAKDDIASKHEATDEKALYVDDV
jgi:hypothetical protein